MSTTEFERQKNIFANNLKKYLEKNEKTQIDLARYIGVSTATVSEWCSGKKLPRMDKLQAISDWFGVQKSSLLDVNEENEDTEYIVRMIEDNSILKEMLLAGGKIYKKDPKYIEALVYTMKQAAEK